jgi:hypothetical protein
MKEIWKDIKGYESKYQISNYGRVKSLDRRVNCAYKATRCVKGGFVSFYLTTEGRPVVRLWKDNKETSKLIHQLVARAFIPNPEGKPEVNHKDGVKDNNNISNLEWVTRLENMEHAARIGLKARKLTRENVIEIKRRLEEDSYRGLGRELAREFKVSDCTICEIKKGKYWRHVNAVS